LDLKTKLSGEDFENIPVDRQRLIYSGRVMKNDDALSVCKIKPKKTIHMVKSIASNPRQPAVDPVVSRPPPPPRWLTPTEPSSDAQVTFKVKTSSNRTHI
jgi:ubiquilin